MRCQSAGRNPAQRIPDCWGIIDGKKQIQDWPDESLSAVAMMHVDSRARVGIMATVQNFTKSDLTSFADSNGAGILT